MTLFLLIVNCLGLLTEGKELVWAGSCDTANLNVYDFRMVDTLGEDPSLTMLLREIDVPDRTHSVLMYDNKYERTQQITDLPQINGHEINIKDSSTALAMISKRQMLDMESVGQPGQEMSVSTCGFVEFDVSTGETSFQWLSGDEITIGESFVYPSPDYIHANSVDKNQYGDYIFSGRHTDTLYLISGKDGHIIWRLGGKENEFEKDFDFAGQHDVKFVSANDTHQVLSFLNNGARGDVVVQPVSSGMYVELDTVNMKATLLSQYVRPDGGSTAKRGNLQSLPNNNVLVSWSLYGYMSEFSHDGKLLMDARFSSDRFSTYRAYKFPWSSRTPSYPPTVVSSCYGVNGSELSTVFYVSWNGATEVKFWTFYASANASSPAVEIGTIPKSGFETSFIARGYMDWVSVKAFDADKKVIGTSDVVRTERPRSWAAGAELPEPDDPSDFDNPTAVDHGVLDYDDEFDEEYDAEETTVSEQAVRFVFLAIGFLASTAGFLFLRFGYPRVRECVGRRYSKAQADDPEETDSEGEELIAGRANV